MPKDGSAPTVMSSVDRALSLLRFFTVETPELGLSALSRAAGFDKTTTLRCLTALERNGLVEQDPVSKTYRIGLAPLQLSQVREQTFPLQARLQPVLDRLADKVEETAHASLIMRRQLMTVGVAEPSRPTRAFIDFSTPLPFHATASGVAILAFMTDDARNDLQLDDDLQRFTDQTPRRMADLDTDLATVRATGVSHVAGTFDDEIAGAAAPVFGPSGAVIGAVAVAAVASRHNTEKAAQIDTALRSAGTEITQQLGGTTPPEFPA